MSLSLEQIDRVQVVDRNTSPSGLSLSFRTTRGGPELELIEWFLERRTVPVPRGHRMTVFREPRVPSSGFPDLVIVIWRASTAYKWSEARAALKPSDLRVMHYLAAEGSSSIEDLKIIFQTPLNMTLERLQAARMIRLVGGRWKANSLTTTFAATRIVAIEAKMSEWKTALDQAHINTWFASQSCVLVPRVPRNSALLHEAEERGVTVLAKEDRGLQALSPSISGPRSYVSWLFNEWAWRAACFGA